MFKKYKDLVLSILKPLFKKNKNFHFLYVINSNLSYIFDEKYIDYCIIDKSTFNKDLNQASLYITTFNSAVSFYMNNNKEYIIERINSIFGYKIVKNLYIKEIPKIVKKKEEIKINKDFSISSLSVEQDSVDGNLKDALNDLGSTIFIEN